MPILGPFNVCYPVIFRSGGDTTRVAFGKHIQEIERIYGILNALDSDKISASDLDGKLGNFKPSLSFNDISGSLDLSRITGHLDASRVIGKLSNANIDADNVYGLSSLVSNLIPDDKGDGIVTCEPDSNGYIKFSNGLILQWGIANIDNMGSSDDNEEAERTASFKTKFPNICLHLQATIRNSSNSQPRLRDHSAIIRSLATDSFVYQIQVPDDETWNNLSLFFLAIGY